MKIFARATVPPAVQVLVCSEAGVSVTYQLTSQQAMQLASDLVGAAAEVVAMRSRITRPLSECPCPAGNHVDYSDPKKGGAA
jgi:hypothetical protein